LVSVTINVGAAAETSEMSEGGGDGPRGVGLVGESVAGLVGILAPPGEAWAASSAGLLLLEGVNSL